MRIGIFRMLLAFFAGVLVTLFLLVPGKTGPTLLVNGDCSAQTADIARAGDRIERLGDQAMVLAYRAKDYLQQRNNQP
jgi:hypothetical protein